MQLDQKQIKKVKDIARVMDNGGLGLAKMIMELGDKIDNIKEAKDEQRDEEIEVTLNIV